MYIPGRRNNYDRRRYDASMGISTGDRATRERDDRSKKLIKEYSEFKIYLSQLLSGEKRYFATHHRLAQKTRIMIFRNRFLMKIKIYPNLSEIIDEKCIQKAFNMFLRKHDIKTFDDLTTFYNKVNSVLGNLTKGGLNGQK